MPNWCYNELIVIGKGVAKFAEFAKTKDKALSFNNFIPYPKKYAKLDRIAKKWEEEHPDNPYEGPKDGYNQGGYEWCYKHWGTKWDASSIDDDCDCGQLSIYDDKTKLLEVMTYHFDTAWCPPEPVIYKMAEMFPHLRFELYYSEEGEAFRGELIIANGDVISKKCEEIPYEEDESKYC